MKKNIVLIAYHKPSFIIKNSIMKPIHVGSALSKYSLKMLRDDSGKNISKKNMNYCELTALYWAWKNLKGYSSLGLMHYRRILLPNDNLFYMFLRLMYRAGRKWNNDRIINFLNMNELFQIRIKSQQRLKRILNGYDKKIDKILENFDIILPKKEFFSVPVFVQYNSCHRGSDLVKAGNIIERKYPEIYPYFQKAMRSKQPYCTNMFIMKEDIFKDYMEFLFGILFELEKKILIPKKAYQSRIFGFLSERLLRPYIEYRLSTNTVKVKELNIGFLDF